MAVRKRGDKYHIRFYQNNKEIWVTTSATLKRDAQTIGRLSSGLSGQEISRDWIMESRLVCIRLFQNQKWSIPEALLDTGLGHSIGPCHSRGTTALEGH